MSKRKKQYSSVESSHLNSDEVRDLPSGHSPKEFYLWCLNCPLARALPGVIFAGVGAMRDALRWPEDAIVSAINVLSATGLVLFDSAAGVLYLPRMLKMDCNKPVSAPQAVYWADVMEDHRCKSLVYQIAEQDVIKLLRPTDYLYASYILRERIKAEDAKAVLAKLAARPGEDRPEVKSPTDGAPAGPLPEVQLPLAFGAGHASQEAAAPTVAVDPIVPYEPPPDMQSADAQLLAEWPRFTERCGDRLQLPLHHRTLTRLPERYDESLRQAWRVISLDLGPADAASVWRSLGDLVMRGRLDFLTKVDPWMYFLGHIPGLLGEARTASRPRLQKPASLPPPRRPSIEHQSPEQMAELMKKLMGRLPVFAATANR